MPIINQQVLDDYQMISTIWEQFNKHCSSLLKQNKQNSATMNAIKKSIWRFYFVKKIIVKSYKYHKSYFTLLNDCKKNSHYHKSTFYDCLNKLRAIWFFAKDKKHWNPNEFVFQTLINAAPIPKNPKRKYSLEIQQQIANTYFYQKDKNFKINKQNIWKQFRNEFNNLSLKTVCEYIKKHPLYFHKSINVVHHRKRKWYVDIGHLQLDVKVIGIKDTIMRRKLYILDSKDQQSKLYWCKLIKQQNKEEMIQGLMEMIYFYQNHGINIKTVRTDNAMVFKKTNWVKTGEFNQLLENFGIIHEYIPLGQPECNGVIERQHRILDDEFVKHNYLIDNFEEYETRLKQYQDYFNYQRYHKYDFMDETNNIHIPIDFLKMHLEQCN